MKQRLLEIIKKALTEQSKKKKCDCGCDTCMDAPLLNESKQYVMPISENMRYHLDKKISIHDNTFRPGSKAHIDLIHEARLLWKKGVIELQGEDKILFENTDLGRFGVYEGEVVPLDLPLMEIEGDSSFSVNKVWDFLETRPFYNKEYMPMFNIAKEIYDEFTPEQMELYNNFEWTGNDNELHRREKAVLQRRKNYDTLSGIKEEKIPGGLAKGMTIKDLANHHKVDVDTIKKALAKGIKVELEHTTNKEIAKEIAMDHVYEDLKYYDKLKKIEEEKKQPALGKPKRGGSKKFYVYVKDPKTKRIKKVSFGMAGGGLRAKLNNPKARAAFSKRHNCPQKKDRTKASYWSCRLPRYAKLLGFKTTFSGFW